MIAIAILIFLFLGSLGGFSTKSQPCTYNKEKMCKSALATAIISSVSFCLGAVIAVIPGFVGKKIEAYGFAVTTFGPRFEGVWRFICNAFRSLMICFLMAANALLVLYVVIDLFKRYFGDEEGLLGAITGYNLCVHAITLRPVSWRGNPDSGFAAMAVSVGFIVSWLLGCPGSFFPKSSN